MFGFRLKVDHYIRSRRTFVNYFNSSSIFNSLFLMDGILYSFSPKVIVTIFAKKCWSFSANKLLLKLFWTQNTADDVYYNLIKETSRSCNRSYSVLYYCCIYCRKRWWKKNNLSISSFCVSKTTTFPLPSFSISTFSKSLFIFLYSTFFLSFLHPTLLCFSI